MARGVSTCALLTTSPRFRRVTEELKLLNRRRKANERTDRLDQASSATVEDSRAHERAIRLGKGLPDERSGTKSVTDVESGTTTIGYGEGDEDEVGVTEQEDHDAGEGS